MNDDISSESDECHIVEATGNVQALDWIQEFEVHAVFSEQSVWICSMED